MEEFKVGDEVIVRDKGCSFTTHRDFFKQNSLEQWAKFYTEDESIPQGRKYKIVATGVHEYCKQYGKLYVLQGHDGVVYIGSNDADYMELVKEDKTMYASELMELARKEPKKYEGKRYKVIDKRNTAYSMRTYDGVEHDELFIKNGKAVYEGGCYTMCTAFIASDTQLEEIPQPVTFMEAVNSGKCIKHIEWEGFHSLDDALLTLGAYTVQQVVDHVNGKCWLIEA